jgi:hypothetical protein
LGEEAAEWRPDRFVEPTVVSGQGMVREGIVGIVNHGAAATAKSTRFVMPLARRLPALVVMALIAFIVVLMIWTPDGLQQLGWVVSYVAVTSPAAVGFTRAFVWRGRIAVIEPGLQVQDSLYCSKGWVIPWSRISDITQTQLCRPGAGECGFSPSLDKMNLRISFKEPQIIGGFSRGPYGGGVMPWLFQSPYVHQLPRRSRQYAAITARVDDPAVIVSALARHRQTMKIGRTDTPTPPR